MKMHINSAMERAGESRRFSGAEIELFITMTTT
jgi:hypothetical protein